MLQCFKWIPAIAMALVLTGGAPYAAETMTNAVNNTSGNTTSDLGISGNTEVFIQSNSLVQANNSAAAYTVDTGHTLKAEDGAQLYVSGRNSNTGTLIVDGTLANEGGLISVTDLGVLENNGVIVNNAVGAATKGMYFGVGSNYSGSGTFTNNGSLNLTSGMDAAGYKTLLESVVNNGTMQLLTTGATDGAASQQDIVMGGGGTGTVEIYFNEFANNFDAGTNKLHFGFDSGVGKVNGVQTLRADTVIFANNSTMLIGLQNPGQVSTIAVTGNVKIEDNAKIGLTAELKNNLLTNSDPKALGAFLTATGSFDIDWYDEGPNLYEVETTIGDFMVEKNGNGLYFSGFEGSVSGGSFVEDYWRDQNGYDVSGFLANSNIASGGNIAYVSGDTNRPTPPGGAQDNFDTLRLLLGMGDDFLYNAPMLESALSSFSGLSFTNPVGVAMGVAESGLANIGSRMNGLRAETRSAAASFTGGDALASPRFGGDHLAANRFWVSGFGSWQNYGEKGGIPGYRYNSGGVMTGYDRWFGQMAVGMAFGYNRGSFKDKAALDNDSDVDNYLVNLYATYYHDSGFFASLVGGYMYSDYDMKKYRAGMSGGTPVLGWERSDYHANTWMIGTQLGQDICVLPRLTLTPTIGLYYQSARSSSYSAEFRPDGGGAASILEVGKVKNHSVSMPIDLAASYDLIDDGCNRLALNGNVGYAYEFHNKGASGTLGYGGLAGAPRVDFRGRSPGRSTWNVGGGVRYIRGNFEFGAKYDYYTKSKYDAHEVTGTIGINF